MDEACDDVGRKSISLDLGLVAHVAKAPDFLAILVQLSVAKAFSQLHAQHARRTILLQRASRHMQAKHHRQRGPTATAGPDSGRMLPHEFQDSFTVRRSCRL